MPSLDDGPAICFEKVSSKEHVFAHLHSDGSAQLVAKEGKDTGTPGAISIGTAKLIAESAIEKSTGGVENGGCSKEDINQQLNALITAPNDTVLRGVKHLRYVTDDIKNFISSRSTNRK